MFKWLERVISQINFSPTESEMMQRQTQHTDGTSKWKDIFAHSFIHRYSSATDSSFFYGISKVMTIKIGTKHRART